MPMVEEGAYAPRKKPVWPWVLAIVGGLFGLAIVGGWFLTRAVVSKAGERGQITRSQSNLRQMATLLTERRMQKGRWPAYSGKAFVLSLAAEGVIDVRNPGNTEIFFSPADPGRGAATVPHDYWRDLTRAALKSGQSFDDLTSYAGRRNLDREHMITSKVEKETGAILADVHFQDVAIVAFTDGSARVLDRGELGLGPNDPIVVGPDSKSPILRQLSDE